MARLSILCLLAASSSAVAYTDASPYILAANPSTRPLAKTTPYTTITSTSAYLSAALTQLRTCSSDAYIIVSQPHLEASDMLHAMFLSDTLEPLDHDHRWTAPHTIIDQQQTDAPGMEDIVQTLMKEAEENCGAQVDGIVDAKTGSFKIFDDMRPKVVRVEFPALGKGRKAAMRQNDAFLHSVMEMLPTKRWTLFYLSSPVDAVHSGNDAHDEVLYGEDLTELRRRETLVEDEDKPVRNTTQGGLFENYQFFTPGVFMGYIAFFFMIMILYVGISSLRSLEVSYGAFDKENAPGAQKKQQ